MFQWITEGSITSVPGFRAAGVTAGFKKSGAPDFAMVLSDRPANFAGTFTSCTFAAAPVRVCEKRVLETPQVRAVIVNSGNANACTGKPGLADAEESCRFAAEMLGIRPEEVLPESTGRIGVPMPMEILKKGIRLAAAALSSAGGIDAAHAIMTTDTVPKYAAVTLTLDGKTVTLGAMTKGAGMIAPQMKTPHATMLCTIATDAKAENTLLQQLLQEAVNLSFNRISVDGDMSTNDTAVLLANGASGVELKRGTAETAAFAEALTALVQNLARRMVMDGEGASKFVEVRITHCATEADGKRAAETIATSMLCKTAWFGNDPNWGRVVAALGRSGAQFDPEKTDVWFGGLPVVKAGGNALTPEETLVQAVNGREFTVLADLHAGDAEYWVWTSDLSYDYVKINADYHT